MKGKEKCKILKEIRQKIADENDIPFVTSECKHQGDCRGTCPKCEAELIYLENQLQKRRSLGRKVALAGLVASFAVAGTSCAFNDVITSSPGGTELDGDIAIVTPDRPTPGSVEPPDELGGEPVDSLTGDMALPWDQYVMKDGQYVFNDGTKLPVLSLEGLTSGSIDLSVFTGIDPGYLQAAYGDVFTSLDGTHAIQLAKHSYLLIHYNEYGFVSHVELQTTPGDNAK